MTVIDKALALLQGVSKALAEGVVHTNKAGERLTTVDAVLRCIRDEGQVWLDNPELPNEAAASTTYELLTLGQAATHIKDEAARG